VETDRGYTNYSPSKTQHNTEPHLLIFSKKKSGALSETPTVYHSFLSTTYDTRHKAVISILFHALQLKRGDFFSHPPFFFCLLPAIVLQRRSIVYSLSLSLGDAHAEAASSPTNVSRDHPSPQIIKTRDFFTSPVLSFVASPSSSRS